MASLVGVVVFSFVFCANTAFVMPKHSNTMETNFIKYDFILLIIDGLFRYFIQAVASAKIHTNTKNRIIILMGLLEADEKTIDMYVTDNL